MSTLLNPRLQPISSNSVHKMPLFRKINQKKKDYTAQYIILIYNILVPEAIYKIKGGKKTSLFVELLVSFTAHLTCCKYIFIYILKKILL